MTLHPDHQQTPDLPEQIKRREGRYLFGLNPAGFDESRPDYPDWIFEHLVERGALLPGTATLEIGPGTGRASRRLLEYGADPLTLVEPDRRFNTKLRSLADQFDADCRIKFASFESARLAAGGFDLVAAATAFHWITPVQGLHKVRRLLNSTGVLALFWNVLQDLDKEDAFHDATNHLLAALPISPSGAPNAVPYALDQPAREADAREAGFNQLEYFESRWTYSLTTEQIGNLYEGFSHIQRLDEQVRHSLLSQLMEVADSQFHGEVERNVTSCLYVIA